uniref:Alginate lyase 2 domain-containing protein n=1 Tax=Aegilops tauschii TaxID=37682 RepID=N1QWE1_AEGTA
MASLTSSPWLHLLLLLVAMGGTFTAAAGSGNPTAGFQKVHLAGGDFQVQSPYNGPESQRFQYRNGVRTFWVHRNDKPFNTATHTNPRSEVRLRVRPRLLVGRLAVRGLWLRAVGDLRRVGDADPQRGGRRALDGVDVHVYDGVLRFYSGAAVESDIYDRWFRLNVMHDVGASTVAVYVDGEHKFSTRVTPSESYYFKFGVYMQHHDRSSCMESRWTNVTLYNKALDGR